jgi:hypothetical protein
MRAESEEMETKSNIRDVWSFVAKEAKVFR